MRNRLDLDERQLAFVNASTEFIQDSLLPDFGVIDLPVVYTNKDQRQQPLLDVQVAKHVILTELLD